ncbi:MAG: DNA translocase FtsK [Patescibacteria group bacterium]
MSEKKKIKGNGRKKTFNPEISRSLGVIMLFIVAIIMMLSYFGLAGSAGALANRGLAVLFGQIWIAVPILLVLLGILVELQKDYPHDSRHFLGLALLLLSVDGLMQLNHPMAESWAVAKQGLGGGIFGFAASYPLFYLFGFWASLIILCGILLGAALLLLNTSLARILQTQKNLLAHLGTLGKIIIGVISLFIKKTPGVIDYGSSAMAEEETASPAFQSQTLKSKDSVVTRYKDSDELKKDTAHLLETTTVKHPNINLPTLDLLISSKTQPSAGDIKGNMYVIQKTLQNFDIPVEMGDVRVGPTVTQYSLKPADGVKLSRIVALHNDMAMALAAHPIRIEAPIPGKSLVGIEVPNQKIALVTLRELMESPEARNHKNVLNIALGKDVSGRPWFADLGALPHMLIAGATGSGKTICINTILMSLLFSHTPETLRFILVDPKRVELTLYNGLPHLLTPVITDVQKTINALRWCIGEMERRFEVLAKAGQRNIINYNKVMEEKMPYIVFMVDELADLMVTAGAEMEAGIIRLAQMARAVGIHLVLATQRPSVDIITGLIKANIPARIAFSVASVVDSRTILDMAGAEKLLGRGDMLWSPPDMSSPRRLQGAFVSEEEVKRVIGFLKAEEGPQYNDAVVDRAQSATIFVKIDNGDDGDSLLEEAKKVIAQAGKASASLLQRRLKVGYARAARLLDLLEAQGMIGPGDGAKPREVLIKTFESNIMSQTSEEDVDKIEEAEQEEEKTG